MADGDIEARTAAVEKLLQLFKLERRVYLAATTVAFLIGIGAAVVMFRAGGVSPGTLTMVFGSSGITSYSANRSLKMFNDSLVMIAGSK